MNRRRLYLDEGPGETRAVVTLDGRPERLLIARPGDCARTALGARLVGRIARIDRAAGGAFLDLGEGAEALLASAPGLSEGAAAEVVIVAEPRRGKLALARLIGPGEGPPGLLAPPPGLARVLRDFAPGEPVVAGLAARDAADAAEDAVLATEFALPGGGSLAIETTRALTAVDIDLGGRSGDPRRAAHAANLAGLAEAARLLRLKGLGGLVVFDLIGKGGDGPALSAAAQAAFAPDEPGVSIGRLSRFGLFEVALPHRRTPLAERLRDASGARSALTRGLALLRAVERAALADPGARLVGRASPDAAGAATPYLEALTARIGPRADLRGDPMLAPDQMEVDSQ